MTDQSSDINTHLASECELIKGLIRLLVEEKEILTKQDAEDIERIAARKCEVLEELTQAEATRNTLFAQAGIAPNRESLTQYINSQQEPIRGQLEKTQLEFQACLKACHDANLVNGMLVNLSLYNNQRMMNLMQGRDVNAHVESYGKDGKIQRDKHSNRRDD